MLKTMWPVIWRVLFCLAILISLGAVVVLQAGIDISKPTLRDLLTAGGIVLAIVTFLLNGWRSEVQRRKQHTMSVLQERFSTDFRVLLEERVHSFPPGKRVDPIEFFAYRDNFSADAMPQRKSAEALQALLNNYEFIALAISKGDLDKEMMRETIRGIMCNLVHDCRDLITDARRKNELLFKNLVPLYREWRTLGRHGDIE